MSDDFDLVRGSGNVFRDLNQPNADLEQLRAILAAQVLAVMDEKKLSVRKLAELTGIDAADFSRIRNANLTRFTVDRLMTILDRLNQHVEVSVTVTTRPRDEPLPVHR
jgi:predicted XRE-type DNA-binding protein